MWSIITAAASAKKWHWSLCLIEDLWRAQPPSTLHSPDVSNKCWITLIIMPHPFLNLKWRITAWRRGRGQGGGEVKLEGEAEAAGPGQGRGRGCKRKPAAAAEPDAFGSCSIMKADPDAAAGSVLLLSCKYSPLRQGEQEKKGLLPNQRQPQSRSNPHAMHQVQADLAADFLAERGHAHSPPRVLERVHHMCISSICDWTGADQYMVHHLQDSVRAVGINRTGTCVVLLLLHPGVQGLDLSRKVRASIILGPMMGKYQEDSDVPVTQASAWLAA